MRRRTPPGKTPESLQAAADEFLATMPATANHPDDQAWESWSAAVHEYEEANGVDLGPFLSDALGNVPFDPYTYPP